MERPAEAKVMAFPANTLFDGVGKSDMPITSKNELAVKLCRQGFALIHCFWFDEAIRSFRDATRLDPDCATAWLGLYVALKQPWATRPDFDAEAKFAIGRAVMRSESASPVEQALIAAYRVHSTGNDDRAPAFERAMQAVLDDHPKVLEPRALWAGMLTQLCMHKAYNEKGDVKGDLIRVANLIEPILKVDPLHHGALHYHIHAFEPSNPARALRSADLMIKVSPRSSHMVHMAGHIYNRLGLFEKAHKAFSGARAIEIADAKTLNTTPYNVNWNYGHNLSFLIMNLAEWGKKDEALKEVQAVPWGRMQVMWRLGMWPELSEAALKQYGASSRNPDARFYMGMAAVARRDWFSARQHADVLDAEVAARLKDKTLPKLTTDNRIDQTMALELRGAVLFMEGKIAEGRAALEAAIAAYHTIEYSEPVIYARPPYDTLAEALMANDMKSEAAAVARRGLKDRPNAPWLSDLLKRARQ